jgi:hypothetical protein
MNLTAAHAFQYRVRQLAPVSATGTGAFYLVAHYGSPMP